MDGHPQSQGLSPTIQNLPEGSVSQTWNFALRLYSQKKDQVIIAVDGQPKFIKSENPNKHGV